MTEQWGIEGAHSALVVVDLQNDFCDTEGAYARAGYPLDAVRRMLPNVVRLIGAAEDSGVPVVLTRLEYPQDAAGRALSMATGGVEPPALSALPDRLIEGTWGAQLFEGIPVPSRSTVLLKHAYSAFHGTRLDTYLRRLSVTTLVICGLASNGCLLHTVFDAHAHGYRVYVPREATASFWPVLDDAAFTIIEGMIARAVTVDDAITRVINSPRLGRKETRA
ncbi:isochorismatase family cysteine hydrolase [Rhizomonospora bruguierae]|uniref:isochorismatase family cysteine hydrolase n=1 Tax=Rhizomonospora bruguierae TaxID=1581705 RepID=UPI0020C02CF7|nr:isochorismatase family cysteine hydrolase [Micromonospora sp. NBRC 107566]